MGERIKACKNCAHYDQFKQAVYDWARSWGKCHGASEGVSPDNGGGIETHKDFCCIYWVEKT